MANNTLCQNGGTCINVGTSHSICVCPPSHSGLYCEEEGSTGAGTEQLDRSSEGEHRTSLYVCHNLHVNTQIIMLCDEQCNYANIGSDAYFMDVCMHAVMLHPAAVTLYGAHSTLSVKSLGVL